MLKAFMASALILASTLTMSAPVTAQTQESVQATSYQVAQRRSSRAYVCTRDRNGYLNLRSGPSLGNRVIGRINNRQYLTILRSSGNWYKVRYRGRIGWVSGDYVCRGNSSRPVGRTNGKRCNALLASIENRMRNRATITIKGTHDYTDSPVNRRHFIFFQFIADGTVGDAVFRKSIASQIIYNCKTIGIVKFGGFVSRPGSFVTDAYGFIPSGKVVRFQCLYGRRVKPRWGQAWCTRR